MCCSLSSLCLWLFVFFIIIVVSMTTLAETVSLFLLIVVVSVILALFAVVTLKLIGDRDVLGVKRAVLVKEMVHALSPGSTAPSYRKRRSGAKRRFLFKKPERSRQRPRTPAGHRGAAS